MAEPFFLSEIIRIFSFSSFLDNIWLVRFSIFLLILSVLYISASKVFKDKKNIAITISFTIALMSAIFIPDQTIISIKYLYSLYGILIMLGIPIGIIYYLGFSNSKKYGEEDLGKYFMLLLINLLLFLSINTFMNYIDNTVVLSLLSFLSFIILVYMFYLLIRIISILNKKTSPSRSSGFNPAYDLFGKKPQSDLRPSDKPGSGDDEDGGGTDEPKPPEEDDEADKQLKKLEEKVGELKKYVDKFKELTDDFIKKTSDMPPPYDNPPEIDFNIEEYKKLIDKIKNAEQEIVKLLEKIYYTNLNEKRRNKFVKLANETARLINERRKKLMEIREIIRRLFGLDES